MIALSRLPAPVLRIIPLLGFFSYFLPVSTSLESLALLLSVGFSIATGLWLSTLRTRYCLVTVWAGIGISSVIAILLNPAMGTPDFPYLVVRCIPLAFALIPMAAALFQVFLNDRQWIRIAQFSCFYISCICGGLGLRSLLG